MSRSRRAIPWIAAAACLAWGVRVVSLVWIGVLAHPLNFDEGAYFSTAALWARGTVLHRDLASVHPPATSYVLAPLTFVGSPSTAFAMTRVAMTLVGALSAYLVGRIALRFVPTWAAVVGVVTYAVLPEAAVAERSVLIEPLLNLACLGAVAVWLSRDDDAERNLRRALVAGALMGLAAGFKVWGVLLVIPLLATVDRGQARQQATRLVVGAAVALAALVAPVALRAPSAFLADVVEFQANRHDGGPATLVDRLFRVVADPRHLGVSRLDLLTAVLVLAVTAVIVDRTAPRPARFALIWFAAVAGVFVVSPTHDQQYNSHLAPAIAILAAWAVAAWWPRLTAPGWRRVAAVLLLASLPAAGLQSLRLIRGQALDRTQDIRPFAAVVRPLPDCVFSFEAGWLLIGDRLPDPDKVGRGAADPYVAALIAANEAGHGEQLLDAPEARAAIRADVERCDTVILGPRGRWHLGRDLAWFEARYHLVTPAMTPGDPDVWQRNRTG